MHEYSGAIHIHSVYSDGTGKIKDIAKAALDSGLDFIILTDHNSLKSKEDGYERWINGVMVIIGYEINDTENKNHYLTLGVDEVVGSYQVLDNGEIGCKLNAKEYVSLVKSKGGIGFIAHPDEERHITKGQISYPWTQWDSDDFTGIEIWNHMSEWMEGMNEQNKLNRFLHPLKSVISPQQKTLRRWDVISQNRHVTAIGGIDAHAFKQNILGIFEVEIFPYKVLFKSIRNHILLEDEIRKNSQENFECDKKKILNALKRGRCFISNYYIGDARGFKFLASKESNEYAIGDTVFSGKNRTVSFKVSAPKQCTIKLIHNGKKIDENVDTNPTWEISEEGIFRIECWLDKRGWIFTNHIRVIHNQ